MNTLGHAVQVLAERCDGAVYQDGIGFNGSDTGFGKSMAGIPESTWTLNQTLAVHRMLKKYKGQLSRLGVDYDAIPEPQPAAADQQAAPSGSIEYDGVVFTLKFPYNPDLVAAVKGLRGRRWSSIAKTWQVDRSPENAAYLATLTGFTTSPEAAAEITRLVPLAAAARAEREAKEQAVSTEKAWAKDASKAEDADLDGSLTSRLGGELMGFQRAGVAYGIRKTRFLLADEMGLGKTVQDLAWMLATNAFPHLVFCPASLKRNWQREAKKWLPGKRVFVQEGSAMLPGWQQADVVIVNYDLLRVEPGDPQHPRAPRVLKGLAAELQKHPWKGLSCDEFHRCKNHKAQRTVAVREIAKTIELICGITGSPVLNRPQELTTPLQILRRLDDVGGFWKFLTACGMYKGAYGMEEIRESKAERSHRLAKVHELLREACMVRRLKADVLPELPAKRRATIPLDIDNRKEYDRAADDFLAWLAGEEGEEAAAVASRAATLAKLTHLRHLAARGKLAAAKEWIEDFLESGEKLVVFAHHVDIQNAIAEQFPTCAVLRGEDNSGVRDENVQRFQTDDECKLIVCSLQAGGVGITLTAASNVAFVEMGWTPGDMDQAEDRCHRIGQTDSVTAWYLLATDTIDEKIAALIDSKRVTVNALVDGRTVEGDDENAVEGSILGLLVERLKGER